jgi:RNA polymerase sigma-70 factor (ECF subfamily)
MVACKIGGIMGSEGREAFEREMLALHAAGRMSAVADGVLRVYGPEILGLLIALLRDHEAAAEVYAEFSAGLWAGLPSFRGESSFRTWAYRIARNAAAHFRRDPLRRRGVAIGDCPELDEIPARSRTETATFRRTESKDCVSALRQSLHPDDQMLLMLRVDRALAWDDIAQIMADAGDRVTIDDAAARRRAAATLRKRFERLKEELRTLVARGVTIAPA